MLGGLEMEDKVVREEQLRQGITPRNFELENRKKIKQVQNMMKKQREDEAVCILYSTRRRHSYSTFRMLPKKFRLKWKNSRKRMLKCFNRYVSRVTTSSHQVQDAVESFSNKIQRFLASRLSFVHEACFDAD